MLLSPAKAKAKNVIILIILSIYPMSLVLWGYFFCLNFLFKSSHVLSQTLNHSSNSLHFSKLDELIQAYNNDPYNIDLILQLAYEYYQLNQLLKATELIFKALQIQPNNIQAYFLLGSIYKSARQFDDSLFCFQKVIKLNPNSYISYYYVGNIYEELGNLEAAKEAYGKALSINPSFSIALNKIKELNNPNYRLPKINNLQSQTSLSTIKNYKIESSQNSESHNLKTSRIQNNQIRDLLSSNNRPQQAISNDAKNAKNKINDSSDKIKISKISRQDIENHKPKTLQNITHTKNNHFFNLAMQEYKNDNLPKAIELYVRALLSDKSLIAEPDNGLLKEALQFLNDRPNALAHGMFYRGFLNFISGNITEAAKDVEIYLFQNTSSLNFEPSFYQEAQNIIVKYHQEQEYKNFLKAQQASETIRTLLNTIFDSVIQPATDSYLTTKSLDRIQTFLSSDAYNILGNNFNDYTIDYIIENAKLLVKQNKYNEALALLAVGLDKEPENIQLLLTLGNTYVEIYIATNNLEAASLAREYFYKVTQLTDQNSNEFKLAYSYIEELDSKLNPNQNQ